MKEGDQNSRFFHLTTLKHQTNNRIVSIKKGQDLLTKDDEVVKEVVQFFSSLLFKDPLQYMEDQANILSAIPSLMKPHHNSMLKAIPSPIEIFQALNSLSRDKAPGPWRIWKECNNRIFRDKEAPKFIIAEKIDGLTSKNYAITKSGNIKEGGNNKARRKGRDKRRKEARWSFPPENWYKANFNGTAKANPSSTGCGGIIRNSSGGGIVALSLPLGHQTNHFVEASAARQIVKLALASGVESLQLEGDSLNIINCINGLTRPSWTIANIIEELRDDLGEFKKTHISHTYCEANMAVDWFANEAVKRNLVMTWHIRDVIRAATMDFLRQDQVQGTNITHFL